MCFGVVRVSSSSSEELGSDELTCPVFFFDFFRQLFRQSRYLSSVDVLLDALPDDRLLLLSLLLEDVRRLRLFNELLDFLGECWWRCEVVKTAGSAGVLSLSCARLTAGRVTTLWVKRPLSVSQQGRLSLPSLWGR